MNDGEMNVGTPESASSSETLFGGEKDYAAMYNMICAHPVYQPYARVADGNPSTLPAE